MRRAATVRRRVGDQLTLDLGGDGNLIVADPKRLYSVGDTVVVVIEDGNLRVGRSGSRVAIPGIGSLTLHGSERVPNTVRVRLERPASAERETDFGSGHRVVPTLMVFELAKRSLT